MTLTDQEKIFDEFVKVQKEILIKKGNDYSNEDRLSNFKLTAQIVGITPEQVCLVMMCIKVARLGVLLQPNAKVNNESVEDSILDEGNYNHLLKMIHSERQQTIRKI